MSFATDEASTISDSAIPVNYLDNEVKIDAIDVSTKRCGLLK